MSFNRHPFQVATVIACLLLFMGCRHTPRYMSPEHGQSYRAAFERQVLNIQAPEDRSPADTLPGAIGSDIYKKRYLKSMTEEKKEKEDSVSRELRDLY